MLRILGRISSINVQKVVWCARELGLPFERTDIGGAFGGTDTPAYRAMNPNGLVPVIDDDGFVMWESNAIVRYLVAGHSEGNLWPDSLKARADADRWMDWQATELGPSMRDAFIQLVRTAPEKRDQTKAAASADASERLIDILDEHLAKRDYVTGCDSQWVTFQSACKFTAGSGWGPLACPGQTLRHGTHGCALVRVRRRF